MGFPNMSSESDNIEIVAGRIAADASITSGSGLSALVVVVFLGTDATALEITFLAFDNLFCACSK